MQLVLEQGHDHEAGFPFIVGLAWIASSKKFMEKSNRERTILLVTVMRMLDEQYARILAVAELAIELCGVVAVMFT